MSEINFQKVQSVFLLKNTPRKKLIRGYIKFRIEKLLVQKEASNCFADF